MPQSGPERLLTRKLVVTLEKASRKNKAPIWGVVAHRLKGSARKRPELNITELNAHTAKGAVALVPGKLLSLGKLDHPVTVATFATSKAAKAKVEAAGGKVITISDLLAQNPQGSKVQLLV